jgi:RNA polymerase sigma-70 factor, ECF subfamily
MDEHADAALTKALVHDLDGAFEALVRAHQDRVYSIALRFLGDARDAEEAAQDAFVRAYRALASYDAARIAELRLRPWLATVVLNICRTRALRRRTRGPKPLSLDLVRDAPGALAEPAAAERDGPVSIVDRREIATAWAARVASLPPTMRAVVVLRHVDGLSYPEIAEALGRPEGTVKAQVHRAMARLRSAYETELRASTREMTA